MAQKAPGKSHREGISLVELFQRFPNDRAAEIWFEEQRWGVAGKPTHCPLCGSAEKQRPIPSRKPLPYWCGACRSSYSVKTGSGMHRSRIGLQKWAIAIYLWSTSVKGVSSMKLHRDLNITQKSAYFMAQRLREARSEAPGGMGGPVEFNEVYFGGKRRNMSNAKRKELANLRLPEPIDFAMTQISGLVGWRSVHWRSSEQYQTRGFPGQFVEFLHEMPGLDVVDSTAPANPSEHRTPRGPSEKIDTVGTIDERKSCSERVNLSLIQPVASGTRSLIQAVGSGSLELGRDTAGKTAVVGAKDRGSNQLTAEVVPSTDKPTLQDLVARKAAPDPTVYTDEAQAYQGISNPHETVNHSVSEYVRGQAHTNGIESFWALLRRGHYGTFHKISPKHLQRYVNEFATRHNTREEDTIAMMEKTVAIIAPCLASH